jgi:hypothetical protein
LVPQPGIIGLDRCLGNYRPIIRKDHRPIIRKDYRPIILGPSIWNYRPGSLLPQPGIIGLDRCFLTISRVDAPDPNLSPAPYTPNIGPAARGGLLVSLTHSRVGTDVRRNTGSCYSSLVLVPCAPCCSYLHSLLLVEIFPDRVYPPKPWQPKRAIRSLRDFIELSRDKVVRTSPLLKSFRRQPEPFLDTSARW